MAKELGIWGPSFLYQDKTILLTWHINSHGWILCISCQSPPAAGQLCSSCWPLGLFPLQWGRVHTAQREPWGCYVQNSSSRLLLWAQFYSADVLFKHKVIISGSEVVHTCTGWMRPWLSVRAMTLRAKCRTLDWVWKNASNTCLRYSCIMELLIPDEMSPISFRSSCLDSFFPIKT